MEFRQLGYFIAVAEEESFTRAAARVHVVQSALSATVQSLEKELGVKLFERTTRRVALTEPGQTLLAQARSILESVEQARDSIAAVVGGVQGTVRLGIMHSLIAPPVAAALADFLHDRPQVLLRPRTHPKGSAGLVQAVIDNELDLAFAAVPSSKSSDVETIALGSEKMVVICSSRHSLAARRIVRLNELADEPFVDVPAGWGSRTSTDQLFLDHGLRRRVEIEVGDVATVIDLVRVGLGIAVVAPSSAPPIDDLVVVQPRPAPTFTVNLVLPKNRQIKPAAQALTDLILERVTRTTAKSPA